MKIQYLTAFASCVLWLGGCATGHIGKVQTALPPGVITTNTPIYVKDFDASNTVFKGDYTDLPERVELARQRVPVIISAELIRHLTKEGYQAAKYSTNVPNDAVIVDGVIHLVDRGSAAARFWVGMGAGMSGVHTDASVYRVSDPSKPLAELQDLSGTSGGTGGSFGYQDWIAANAKDLAMKLGNFLMGKTKK